MPVSHVRSRGQGGHRSRRGRAHRPRELHSIHRVQGRQLRVQRYAYAAEVIVGSCTGDAACAPQERGPRFVSQSTAGPARSAPHTRGTQHAGRRAGAGKGQDRPGWAATQETWAGPSSSTPARRPSAWQTSPLVGAEVRRRQGARTATVEDT